MRKNYLDISEKIESNKLAALEGIAHIAASEEIPFFLVGALARDLILAKGHNIRTYRATLDIGQILTPDIKDKVLDILDKETGHQEEYRLVADMFGSKVFIGADFNRLLSLPHQNSSPSNTNSPS
ncbi:MAG: hypothetical protein J7L72_09365 [Candidatus Aminicenantes bacterium]|nr:hypothetical protein [Candidatus Aminicenantes bacterium]